MRRAVENYLDAENHFRLARAARDKAFRAAYPIGSEVEWLTRGRYLQRGSVVMYGHADRVKVLNAKTDREVWITGYDIRQASN
jgi:hypothetical protein